MAKKPAQRMSQASDVSVIAAAAGWIAIHKPAGISVHNDPETDLCHRVAQHLEINPELGRTVGLDRAWGVHAVHRLDRDTSGILLLATRAAVFSALSEQFTARKVRKRYLTVVHGCLTRPSTGKTGEWTWPLAARAGGRQRPAGGGKKLPSRTHYQVEQLTERYSLLSCEPVTGRQHQIRRHAKLSGHPVVGDRRYSPKRALTYLQAHCPDLRLALHAWQLGFFPPGRGAGTQLVLTADPVPDFMRHLMGDVDVGMLKKKGW